MSASKRGRPVQSNSAPKSAKQVLKILKTKTWAWTCAYALKSQHVPAGVNLLAKAANDFCANNGNHGLKYDGSRWSRWRSGKIAANPNSVLDLWQETQGAYFVGPWIRNNNDIYPYGGFIPLWSTIASDDTEQLLVAWNNIDWCTWLAWAPDNDSSSDIDESYVPDPFKGIIDIYDFALHILNSKKQLPGLLVLAAAIIAARLKGQPRLDIFATNDRDTEEISVPETMSNSISPELDMVNINISELSIVTKANGLELLDHIKLKALVEKFLEKQAKERIECLKSCSTYAELNGKGTMDYLN